MGMRTTIPYFRPRAPRWKPEVRSFWGDVLKKIAPNGGRRENFGGISCEKSRFYAKKIIFFPILGEGRRVRPHLDPPLDTTNPADLA
jgi:hypothetical protein